MSGMWLVGFLGLWVLVLLQTLLFVALLRQVGVLHTRVAPRGAMGTETPTAGDIVPQTVFETLDGHPVRFAAQNDKDFLALFVTPACSVCKDVMPGFRALSRERQSELDTVLAIGADEVEAREYTREHSIRVATVADPRLLHQFKIPTTPYGVVINSEGRISAAGLVNNLEQVESLLLTAAEQEVTEAENGSASVAGPAERTGALLQEGETKWEKASTS